MKGSYHSDVRVARAAVGTTRNVGRAFAHHETVKLTGQKCVHPDLDIKGRIRECCDSPENPRTTPISVLMDVTSSRGDDAKKIYTQVPSMLGVLRLMEYVTDPQICWGAIGDVNSDAVPLQLGQYEADRRIDAFLEKIFMEGGGGGTGEENYELMAYALAYRTMLDCWKRNALGYAFFMGDEAPYAELSPGTLETYLGVKVKKAIPTVDIFRELRKKYHTFLIFPRTSAEQRKSAIDTEIRRRLEAAGGRFREVDIRCSLLWNNCDDLDLHCLTPGGCHIYYANKRSHCRGELDVDRNVNGETSKPVENIRWAKGQAPAGKYRFWVELYRHHERASDVPFKLELDVNGKIETLEGHTRSNCCHEKVVGFDINYDPRARQNSEAEDGFAAYGDNVVLEKWGRYLPPGNILRVEDASSSVEVMLGALALQHGVPFEQFLKDMKARKVAKGRRDDVEAALSNFAEQGVFAKVDGDAFA